MGFTKSVYRAQALQSLESPSNALSEPNGSSSRSVAFNCKTCVLLHDSSGIFSSNSLRKMILKISYEINNPFKQMTCFINHNIYICERHMTYLLPRQCGLEES